MGNKMMVLCNRCLEELVPICVDGTWTHSCKCANKKISPEALAWADLEIEKIEKFKAENPDWESQLVPLKRS